MTWSKLHRRRHWRLIVSFLLLGSSVGLIGSILVAFVGAVVLIALGRVASSLAWLLFARGIPAVAMVGLVVMLVAADVFARRYPDAT